MPREERRALLLEVARGLFAERGYHGTSVGDIARATPCSEAVLYQHFGGKLELFLARHAAADGDRRRCVGRGRHRTDGSK